MPNTIAENLQRLVDAKNDIADAITTMGGTVNTGDGFEEFPDDIHTIPAGGGSEIDGTITPLWNYGVDNTKSFAKQYGNTIAITITATNSITGYAGRKMEVANVSGLVLPASLDGAIVSVGLSNITLSSSSAINTVNAIAEYVNNQTLKLSIRITYTNEFIAPSFSGIGTITAVINLPE